MSHKNYQHLRRIYVDVKLFSGQILTKNCSIMKQNNYFHYLKQVLRLQNGDLLRIFNKDEEYLARYKIYNLVIENLISTTINTSSTMKNSSSFTTNSSKTTANVSKANIMTEDVINVENVNVSTVSTTNSTHIASSNKKPKISVALGLLKPNNLTESIEMLTQFCIDNIFLILSNRVQISKDHIKNFNLERYKKIAISSLKQSEKFTPTNISEIIKLEEFLAKYNDLSNNTTSNASNINSTNIKQTCFIVCDENRYRMQVNSNINNINHNVINQNSIMNDDFMQNLQKYEEIIILIGPEGGFTLEESKLISSFKEIFYLDFSSILKSQVAAVASVSILQFLILNPLN